MFSPEWFFPKSGQDYLFPNYEIDEHCGILILSSSHQTNISLCFQLALHHAIRGENVVFFCNRMEMYNNPPCMESSASHLGEHTLNRISFRYPQSFQEVQNVLLSYLNFPGNQEFGIPRLLIFQCLDSLQSIETHRNRPMFDKQEYKTHKNLDHKALTISLAHHVLGSLHRKYNKPAYYVVCERLFIDYRRLLEDSMEIDSQLAHFPTITHVGMVHHYEHSSEQAVESSLQPLTLTPDIEQFMVTSPKKQVFIFIFKKLRDSPWLEKSKKRVQESIHLRTHLLYSTLFCLGDRFRLLWSAYLKNE